MRAVSSSKLHLLAHSGAYRRTKPVAKLPEAQNCRGPQVPLNMQKNNVLKLILSKSVIYIFFLNFLVCLTNTFSDLTAGGFLSKENTKHRK